MTIFYTNNPERNPGAKTTQDPLSPQSGGSSAFITGAGQIPSAEGIGQPSFSVTVFLAAIASAEAVGQPSAAASVAAAGVASAEAIGAAVVGAAVSGAGQIASAEVLGQPTVAAAGGAQEITGAGGITSGEAFGQPALQAVAVPSSSGGTWWRLPRRAHKIVGAGNVYSTEVVSRPRARTVLRIEKPERIETPLTMPRIRPLPHAITGAGGIAEGAVVGKAAVQVVSKVAPPAAHEIRVASIIVPAAKSNVLAFPSGEVVPTTVVAKPPQAGDHEVVAEGVVTTTRVGRPTVSLAELRADDLPEEEELVFIFDLLLAA